MFSTPAFAQAAGAANTAAADGGLQGMLLNFAPFILIGLLFYMLLWRPQQQRAKEHRNTIASVKRSDTVILSSGVIGKVVRVEDAEIGVEIAQGVTIKVVKSMIAEVRARGAPAAANDAKS
jgi:preprotein translocase subunit YajC